MSEPKTYTTAIIAAVPSQADPVHEVVAEDAHVTLQFLGEAADLTPEGVAEIQATLEMLSSVVYPFPVSISGTAELGPDKAQVLIVQSELLTKVREMLALSDAVSTALATTEQFPNWIPHLTLDYSGEMPDVATYKTVEIGSLELWLADEHHAYPLNQKDAPVVAAGQKIFEEGLHPRGADGRFIEKFGVIKFLSSLGWQYGKVDGIYHDQASGAVKLTVTPSDLSGNPKGESVVLSPKQVYRAPKPKVHLTTTSLGVTKVGGQGGSNPGGLYTIPKVLTQGESMESGTTEKFYVKTPKSKSHGNNEALANAFYEEAGVPVPEVDYHSDGQLYSKIVTGQQDMATQLNNDEWTDQVRRNFAVDAWLGNRDVFGMTYDNILTDEHGVPWRIDNGGALLYRAMGAKKTDFEGQVTELDSFRQGKKAKIFGPGMSKAQELDGAERVLAISPSQIEEMVAEHNMPKSLADTLKARRLYIASYYGLTLPESKKPAEAEEPTSAPLIDAPDIAENEGKNRNWFKTSLAQVAMFGEAGDVLELPDGSTQMLGVDENQQALSVVGEQAQLLNWQHKHGAGAGVYLKKAIDPQSPRPEHGSTLAGADLSAQRWKRGDLVIDADGIPWKVKLWNEHTGAVLLQFTDKDPVLFDTKGKDANLVFKVERWDPPVVDTLEPVNVPEPAPVMTEQQALDEVQQITPAEMPNATTDVPGSLEELAPEAFAPVPGKTGQAAVAEAQIKADLDQPLPSGNGTPAPKKTSAPGGAKVMVIGDGTEAATGDAVLSKKDGKTYTFVKPKGQYAVVTDPNGEDPNKQLLKLASTMTQPGKAPAADTGAVEAPKTATGEVPALGMMALAKDGWAGEITLISPDGKFVFITDANGTRKRKSTGTVSITSAPQGVPEAPKKAPGPIKDYGPTPALQTVKESIPGMDMYDSADLDAGDIVVVGYADGTWGLEPYTDQPVDSLLTNTQGKIATPYALPLYKGPISDTQFIAASAASGSNGHNYTVVWDGTITVTNGTTGPNGGLLLWSHDNPQENVFELPAGQTLTILSSSKADGGADGSTPLPSFDQVQSAQDNSDFGYVTPGPLYNDEAKTLADWKGQLPKGSQISLDGKNWLTIEMAAPISGNVIVTDLNGTETTISATSLATFVLKAPDLKDGNDNPAWKPDTTSVDVAAVPEMGVTKKKIGNMVGGDVVTDGEGNVSIIDYVDDNHGVPGEVQIKSLGEDWASPANPEFEFDYHGNITENPVPIPLGVVVPHLYPGATLQLADTELPAQVISYPQKQDNGSYKVALMVDGDPDNLQILHTGVDVSETLSVQASLGSFTSAVDAGVDPTELNLLWEDETTVDIATPLDHKIEMTEAGVPFGTAAYPIFYNSPSGTYFRPNAEGGLSEWDSESGTWSPVGGNTAGMDKVWDGVPFEGQLAYPDNIAALPPMLQSGAPLTDYKPQPGEIVQAGIVDMPSGPQSFLVVYSQGLNGPAQMVMSSSNPDHYQPHLTSTPMSDGWQTTGTFHDLVTIHDPFAGPAEIDHPVTHQIGPQPPSVLGARLQTLGYTPNPGDTIWVATVNMDSGPTSVVLLKQPDGNYKKMGYNGSLGNKEWTPEELKDYQPPNIPEADVSHFTWTYQPVAGEGSPAVVPGLPEGFQPFTAGDGQSVLKVTLANGKTNVYLQKQPGAGWYEMGPDGTVNEHSDAVKSNHAVQLKLQGKGSQTATYELLHPVPEGSKAPGKDVPTFSTAADGDWTPEPHQKVMSMVGYDGDPNPWYWHQDEPGGYWEAAPNSPGAPTSISDATMQGYIEASKNNSFQPYTLVYDGASGQAAVDTPEKKLASFQGYTPKPGDQVISLTQGGDTAFYVHEADDTDESSSNYSYWQPVIANEGVLDPSAGMAKDEVPANLGPEHGNDFAHVWPEEAPSAPEAAPEAPAEPQTFSGYTPGPDDKVAQIGEDGAPNTHFYVQAKGSDTWQLVVPDGSLSLSGPIPAGQMPLGTKGVKLVHGVEEPLPGSFGGYQTEAGDIVFQLTDANTQPIYIKKASTNEWHLIKADGTLSADTYGQATIDWATGEYQVAELQGSIKGQVTEPDEPVTSTAYAGVASTTQLTEGSYHFGEFIPAADQLSKLKKLGALDTGQSAYALEYQEGGSSGAILIRNSQGQWSSVLPTGELAAKMPDGTWGAAYTVANDDEGAEAYLKSAGFQLHKMQFSAPATAPSAPVSTGPPAQLSGWEDKGIPNPAAFTHIGDASQGKGAKAGDMMFVSAQTSGGGGLLGKFAEDWDGTSTWKFSEVIAVDTGGVVASAWIPAATDNVFDFHWQESNNHWVSGQTQPFTPAAPAPGGIGALYEKLTAPSAPSPAAPSAPAAPSYPGAQKPSQEDINAWGGALTKDGHIPTAGLHVSGKGPMIGKIISVSKDKSKAVVLTSDGKKTTRLIEALKVDIAANYSAYAAPISNKPVPSGMAIAVDTPDEVLAKTVNDGKMRAIVSNHAGVLHGEMTVSAATGPSGKKYNRVHLTLTDEQREQLVAMLAGQGEKGDWATSSKMSEAVAVGDKLPMRLSSTTNPDGSARWKVDPSQVPPTHEVIGVTDEPGGTGVKLVTMKHTTTGEEITSRFHPGKSLTTYTWDPNKPKKVAPGAFSLSEIAKAQGWSNQKDGVISATKADGTLYVEPGKAVPSSGTMWGGGQGMSSTWDGLRNVTTDGVVIEITDPKGPKTNSNSGFTVISVPEGMGADALNGALAKLGIEYSPLTQDGAKDTARGLIRNLLTWDKSDIHSAKGWTDEKLFTQAGQAIGISDLGWQDVLVGVDESTGKVSYFWSQRVQTALATKVKHNLIYRAASNGQANAIINTVKYGTANALLKRSVGMIDAPSGKGVGASPGSDNGHHAGHGGFASASNTTKLPTSNGKATYKGSNMMVYMRPEAVLGRIMDYRVSANSDAFGEGEGQGSNNLKNASSLSGIKDYFLGGGLPSEAISYIAVTSASERSSAIKQLHAEGITQINGRPIEEIVILQTDADKINVKDLPVVTPPGNARSVLDLPTSYDAPAAAGGAVTADASEAAA